MEFDNKGEEFFGPKTETFGFGQEPFQSITTMNRSEQTITLKM